MVTYRAWGLWVCLGLAGIFVGCSADSDAGEDDDSAGGCAFAACGGDVVGTWQIDSVCVTLDEWPAPSDDPECQDFVRDYSVDVEGSITFTADGMTTTSLTSTSTLDVAVTDACWQALGGTDFTSAACDAIEAEYLSAAEYSSAGCTFLSATCSCTLVTQPGTTNETGTYSFYADQLIDQDGALADYCVDGDRFSMSTESADSTVVISAGRVP